MTTLCRVETVLTNFLLLALPLKKAHYLFGTVAFIVFSEIARLYDVRKLVKIGG